MKHFNQTIFTHHIIKYWLWNRNNAYTYHGETIYSQFNFQKNWKGSHVILLTKRKKTFLSENRDTLKRICYNEIKCEEKPLQHPERRRKKEKVPDERSICKSSAGDCIKKRIITIWYSQHTWYILCVILDTYTQKSLQYGQAIQIKIFIRGCTMMGGGGVKSN